MQLYAHLWTGGPIPPEYIELQLCREFHCLPSQLRQENIVDVYKILDMLDVEARVKNKRNGK